MRVEYGSVEKDGSPDLDDDWLADGWIALLRKWLADAQDADIAEPNAMVIGTVDDRGRPVTRTVLCKGVDEAGITFFTNYDSDKGEQLADHPVRLGDVPVVRARTPGARPGPGDQGVAGSHRRLLVQATARLAARGMGVAPVAADRVARGAARPAGRGHRAVRRPRRRAGAAELGRLPHRTGGRRVLAGPGEPGAQQDSRGGTRAASSGCSPRWRGSSPTPRRYGRRTSVGCGWRASSPSSAATSPSSRCRFSSTR